MASDAHSSELLQVIDEQVSFGFTGKINLLLKENGQMLGHVLLREGEITGAHYKEVEGLKALFYSVIENSQNDYFRVVVEPEIVEEDLSNIFISYSDIINRIKKGLDLYHQSKHLKPSLKLKFIVKSDFIRRGQKVRPEEFDLMCTISDYPRVKDIYQYSQLLEHEVTMSLVTLRQKGALKVIRTERKST